VRRVVPDNARDRLCRCVSMAAWVWASVSSGTRGARQLQPEYSSYVNRLQYILETSYVVYTVRTYRSSYVAIVIDSKDQIDKP
jgi:hypothetical protein